MEKAKNVKNGSGKGIPEIWIQDKENRQWMFSVKTTDF